VKQAIHAMALSDITEPSGTAQKHLKGTADAIELSGAQVTHVAALLETFHAFLGLSQAEKISSFAYDVARGEWTIIVQ